MMSSNSPETKKPLFSALALCAAVIALILMATFDLQDDRYRGYGPGSLATSFTVALLLSGLIAGQIGLIRGEIPRAFPILALLLNGGIFFAAIVLIPR